MQSAVDNSIKCFVKVSIGLRQKWRFGILPSSREPTRWALQDFGSVDSNGLKPSSTPTPPWQRSRHKWPNTECA
jgi:hypothetical protein